MTCSYIHPQSKSDIYIQHSEAITYISSLTSECDELIVLGDFNLPNILWFPNDDSFGLLPSCIIPWICDFLDIISDCGLSQMNYLLNPCNNNLDISFVDLSTRAIVRSDQLSIPEDVFHPTFKLSFVIDKMQKSNSNCLNHPKKFLTFIELTILN